MSGPVRTPDLQVTYDGMRPEQIDRRWVERGGGVEAYVFDGAQLAGPDDWRTLAGGLARARDAGARVVSLHFPTEHADWVHDPAEFDKLRTFCDVAERAAATGVGLHANQFVGMDDWPAFDLESARARVVERVALLDEHLAGSALWIGIENMPVIGSEGTDFDSIFVQPGDFAGLAAIGSGRIGVTWDLCHWAVTWSTARAVAHLERRASAVDPLDLPPLPVRHVHFGSFAGHAMPYWGTTCFEGATPQDGTFDPSLLEAMLATVLRATSDDVSVVLEVQERDYEDRRNSWRTLEWIRSRPGLGGVRPRGAGT